MLSINREALQIGPSLLGAIIFPIFVAVDAENNPPWIPHITLLFQERLCFGLTHLLTSMNMSFQGLR